jgi:hypothetical protein
MPKILYKIRKEGSNANVIKYRHVEEISKNPRIDVEKVRNINYLHEFDRSVLYRRFSCDNICLLCTNGIEWFRVQHGDIQQKVLTTVTHLHRIRY